MGRMVATMRIAYAVHGYGRGHATRALALLPQLREKHQVLVLAGGDAFASISPDYSVARIPTLGFAYGSNSGKRSNWQTFKRNLPAMVDMFLHGPVFRMVTDALADFAPSVVISDAEGWSHRAARALKIPRISIDHIGVLDYCRVPIEWRDRLEVKIDRFCYRKLMCSPERVIVSSFFNAPPRRRGVIVVGTLARQEIRQAKPSNGQHLLVYLNQGLHQLGKRILAALDGIGVPVHIYGTQRRGREGQLQFLPTSNLPFVEDLASCRAVISTAGNQLVGEAIVLGKPVLVMPEDCVEQRLNAAAVKRMGIGMRTLPHKLTASVIRRFLDRHDEFAANLHQYSRDGLDQTLATIDRFLAELAPAALLSDPTRCAASAAKSSIPAVIPSPSTTLHPVMP